jgi:hypothetical protein
MAPRLVVQIIQISRIYIRQIANNTVSGSCNAASFHESRGVNAEYENQRDKTGYSFLSSKQTGRGSSYIERT